MTTAVILAGGLGTRLRSVVDDRPKPMAEVAGKPFLEHLMRYWHDQGIERFILSVGYRAEQIECYFGSTFEGHKVEYVREQVPLGTGGALLLCQESKTLKEPFLLLNGDTYFQVNLQVLQEMAKSSHADWVLSLFPTNDSRRYMPIKVEGSGRILFESSVDQNRQGQATWANGGVYWVNPRALTMISESISNESLETGIFPKCVTLGQSFFGLRSEKLFIDIGVPNDYSRAQTMPCFTSSIGPKH